jgi:probable HAF family extracellular repeat protein
VVVASGTRLHGTSQADIKPRLSSIGVNPQADPIHAFLWKNGDMTDLGTLGGDYSYAGGIDPLGDVVGESKTATGRLHAFLWSNGTMTHLGPTAGQAYGINRSGRVVNRLGRIRRLRTIGGDLVHGQALAINADGETAGESTTAAGDVSHATLWTLK